jgi:diguanylate cyclase (GGDEF)-like protein
MAATTIDGLRVPTVGELVAHCQKLPSPPGLILQIVRQTDDDRTTVAALSRTIGRDAGLASKLIRMANSPLFSPVSEITTIDRAVTMLGLRSVKLLALSLSVDSLLPGATPGAPEATAVRRRSLVNGVLSRQFVPARHPVLADEVFLLGLVGHLGRLGLAHAAPDVFAHLVHQGGGWSRPADERALLGVTGDELAAALLGEWGLPERMVSALRHRDPGSGPAPAPLSAMVDALRVGLLAEEVLCGQAAGAALRELRAVAGTALGLTAGAVDRILIEAEPVLDETARLLRLELPAGTSHEQLLAEAMAEIAALSAGAAAELTEGRRRTAELADENARLSTQARTDALTGLANRGTLDDYLARQLAGRSRREWDDVLGVLLIDLDRFKRINDQRGHATGDDVLRAIGHTLARTTRRDELAARYGGEEFVLVLPHTSPAEMHRAAERIRREIAALRIAAPGGAVKVTASIGGAYVTHTHGDDPAADLLRRADAKLYEAKRAGRNACRIQAAG